MTFGCFSVVISLGTCGDFPCYVWKVRQITNMLALPMFRPEEDFYATRARVQLDTSLRVLTASRSICMSFIEIVALENNSMHCRRRHDVFQAIKINPNNTASELIWRLLLTWSGRRPACRATRRCRLPVLLLVLVSVLKALECRWGKLVPKSGVCDSTSLILTHCLCLQTLWHLYVLDTLSHFRLLLQ